MRLNPKPVKVLIPLVSRSSKTNSFWTAFQQMVNPFGLLRSHQLRQATSGVSARRTQT
jgi:hypothetical protein